MPESKSLLHLDLSSNPIDTAGVLALSVGLKSNHVIRCLDLSIPPNSPELAELSQSILQSCIRNTEIAAAETSQAKRDAIWGPIKKSSLVRDVRKADEDRATHEREQIATSPEGLAREYAYTLPLPKLIPIARSLSLDLQKWYDAAIVAAERPEQWRSDDLPRDDFPILYQRAKALRERLVDTISQSDADDLQELLVVNDDLTSRIEQGTRFRPPPRVLLPSQMLHIEPPLPLPKSRRHMRSTSLEISSPNFSIGDSDNDSDAEEIDVQKITPQKAHIGIGIALNDDSTLR